MFQIQKANKKQSKMSQPMDDQPSTKLYGGCEGPDAMYVKLISSDGHEFIGKFIISFSFNQQRNTFSWYLKRDAFNICLF